jgi:hypothetical protein
MDYSATGEYSDMVLTVFPYELGLSINVSVQGKHSYKDIIDKFSKIATSQKGILENLLNNNMTTHGPYPEFTMLNVIDRVYHMVTLHSKHPSAY